MANVARQVPGLRLTEQSAGIGSVPVRGKNLNPADGNPVQQQDDAPTNRRASSQQRKQNNGKD
jgi:hypothetical protein